MPSKTHTAKQIAAAKKKRSTTLKNLNNIYKESNDISDKIETLRKGWVECMETKVWPFELTVSKRELKKLEEPCKKIRNEMTRLTKKEAKLLEKSNKLEESAAVIEEKYNIPANEPY